MKIATQTDKEQTLILKLELEFAVIPKRIERIFSKSVAEVS